MAKRRKDAATGASTRSTRLQRYRAKRDFSATSEPAGGRDEGGGEPRFVIHEHHARSLHWDLRLERDGVLASWAVPKGLPPRPRENRLAVATEDHPLEYLEFAGDIPAGQYGAGHIGVWDRGTYECLKWEPRKIEVALHGERLNARYALFPIDRSEPPKNWNIHRMDPPDDDAEEPMPAHLTPMLATSGALPPDDGRWAHEIKWDGVRALAYSRPGELRLESRNLNDITDTYPELSALGRALGSSSAVLDGEIVAFDEQGLPSFEALQQRMHTTGRAQAARLARTTPVSYVAFDLLWHDGRTLMALPYSARRERLQALKLAGEAIQVPEHIVGQGAQLLRASSERGLEGIVAKRLDSVYQPGRRSRDWLKIKSVERQEFVVGGWLPVRGSGGGHIGALLVGVNQDGGALRYVARVGSGIGADQARALAAVLAGLERQDSPFAGGPKLPAGAVFCKPLVVVEVQFAQWTRAGSLRHPSYKGIREDKLAADVVREGAETGGASPAPERMDGAISIGDADAETARVRVEGRELQLSNLTKIIYPQVGFSKRDLIEYYAAVAPTLIPYLRARPLTVTRWPDGVDGKSFFQKQAPAQRPEWVRTFKVAGASKPVDHVLAQDLATLVWLANSAAIELHVPLACAPDMERPTALVFDLDPGAPATIVECCRVALLLHGMLENVGLTSFAKTSGSKGLQVYVPLNTDDVTYEQTKPFARLAAQLLEQAEPELVVSNMKRALRPGRVLIDWSQNSHTKTTVCVYSLRASARPTVSTPLQWEEVRRGAEERDPESLVFTYAMTQARLAEHGDLFAPVLSLVQELPRG